MFGNEIFIQCVKILKIWQPKQNYSNEKDYQDDLRDFLFKELNKPRPFSFGEDNQINIKSESGRSKCDLAVGRAVGIELKFSKTGKIKISDIDRLDGQVRRHIKDYSQGVIVVLVGDINCYSEADVKDKINEIKQSINNSLGLNTYNLGLVNKSYNKPVQKQSSSGFRISSLG